MKFTIGDGVDCDLEQLVESRLLVQAQSGGGKTTLLRRILEQTHGEIQQIVLDPEGEFFTLRERFDYIIAGKGGDCAADPRSAKLLAHRLLELGVSTVCDLSELKAHDRVRFVRVFLEALVEAPRKLRHPVLVVIDEAHVFCPEKGQAESAAAVIDLCARGRKRGLCALLATQRLSKLHKDAAAELRNVLIGATGLDIDQQRAGDVLGFQKAERLALRDLGWGDFYAYGPALAPGVVRLKVGETATFNPKLGRDLAAPAQPTPKIRELLSKVVDLPAEAEAERQTVDTLKRDNATLRAEATRLRKQGAPPDETVIERRVEVAVQQVEREHDDALTAIRRLQGGIVQAIGESVADLERVAERLRHATNGHGAEGGNKAARVGRQEPRSRDTSRPPSSAARPSERTDALSAAQQRILDVLAELETLSIDTPHKSVVAVFAGVSPTSGGYFNNLGRLRSMGMIDYPEPSLVALDGAGRDLARPPDAPSSLADLHEAWYRRVSGSQAAILKAAVAIYPDDIAKDELAEQLGVSPTSGGYFNNLGRLRGLGAIDYPTPGRVVATALLFPENLA